jgi:hypothetical protein
MKTSVAGTSPCLFGGLLGCLLLAGCAPGTGSVRGVVRYQGKPVAGGTILFFDARQQVHQGEIHADGSYEVTDVTAGTARVAVVAPLNIPFQALGRPKSSGMPGMEAAPPPQAGALPAKYADPATSGLTFPVGRGSNQWDPELPP